MKTDLITIVDYGVGNLYSVRRALEVSGATNIRISGNPSDIADADRVILPGVGAFEDGMRGLRELGLAEPLIAAAQTGKPILGICLGMQMLVTTSEEFGNHQGLNLIPGEVKAIPRLCSNKELLKVPFIGWAPTTVENSDSAADSCIRRIGKNAIYLVHSFHVIPCAPLHLLASYNYGGHRITAAIRKDNITGVQFHPEKSGSTGLAIVRDFVEGGGNSSHSH